MDPTRQQAAREALERAQEVLWLVDGGVEPHEAARRVGTSLGAVEKSLQRHGHTAEWARIRARLPLPLVNH